MRVYHYHPTTGEFLGIGWADESPRDKGVFLYPAHTTNIEPPAQQEGKTLIFDLVQWQYADIPTQPDEIPKVLTEEEQKEKERQGILQQLAELDKILTRPQENQTKFLITQGYEPYQTELYAIERKQVLRLQLNALED